MSLRDIRRHAGRLLLVGFDGYEVGSDLRALARAFDLGGAVLFERNIDEPRQVADLSRQIGELGAEVPPWIAVDQEGGRVARLPAPFTQWPPARAIGACGDFGLVRRFARALAVELRAAGITLDFAPVLDVQTNPANTVIGDRAFSDRPETVARLGRIVIEELQAAGVAACGKHFPGHGDTTADSHVELPVVDHPLERLRQVEFVPFAEAVRAGVACLMTAHLLVPAVDDERPATVSAAILGLLRRELGFDGLVIADDLEMAALAHRYRAEEAAVRALAAGCDLLLLCRPDPDRQVAVIEAIIHAVEEGTVPPARVEEALKRDRRAKERLLAPDAGRAPVPVLADVLARREHLELADELARTWS
ncbi:MAG TPA: beta-N-acetylhexosaminidase [Vicinamibacterales bacterium]|nr:beta-N-acetylhexosaminidase [Vicinamibacterales bacterium]